MFLTLIWWAIGVCIYFIYWFILLVGEKSSYIAFPDHMQFLTRLVCKTSLEIVRKSLTGNGFYYFSSIFLFFFHSLIKAYGPVFSQNESYFLFFFSAVYSVFKIVFIFHPFTSCIYLSLFVHFHSKCLHFNCHKSTSVCYW